MDESSSLSPVDIEDRVGGFETDKSPVEEETRSITLDDCNANTQFFDDPENKRVIYVFNYDKLKLNRHSLKKLRDEKQWDVIKHPLVLNYVNEHLVKSAWMYTLQIFAYFSFFILLYCYNHATADNHTMKGLMTGLMILFIIGLFVKAKLKIERDGCLRISIFHSLSYVFFFMFYVAVLVFVWAPYIYAEDYQFVNKKTTFHYLPIVLIIVSWIQLLHVLRKTPYGVYIMMMTKILCSFRDTAIIWLPTLMCFSFCFQLVMQDSKIDPWDDPIIANSSASVLRSIFRSFTMTSAMMIGELEAKDILNLHNPIPNLLLIVFELVTVILLMNLMISLAVDDVKELRASAEDRSLHFKTDYVIEMLHFFEKICSCCQNTVNNVVVVSKNYEENDIDVVSLNKPLVGRRMYLVKMSPEQDDVIPDKPTVPDVENAKLRELQKEESDWRKKYARRLIGVKLRSSVPVR